MNHRVLFWRNGLSTRRKTADNNRKVYKLLRNNNVSLHSHEREALAARAAFVNAYGYNVRASHSSLHWKRALCWCLELKVRVMKLGLRLSGMAAICSLTS